MIHFRTILYFLGLLLLALGVIMLVPGLVDALDDKGEWEAFIGASAIACFIGVSLLLVTRGNTETLSVRESFILTSASWFITVVFAALPFYFATIGLSYTDAFFEAMSGITTTGSTVIVDLNQVSAGILLWRALLQWLGGVGFIVLAISVLPALGVSGNQLFQTEFSDKSAKTIPRITSLASWIGTIYLILTGICAAAYWIAGMSGFNAIAHAMTTIATGGFSTSDVSFALFDSAIIEAVAIIFMILGSLPFVIYIVAARGNPRRLASDSQVQWFFCVLAVSIFAITIWQMLDNDVDLGVALRQSAFNVTSIVTGTGYASTDYWQWGTFPAATFLMLMFVGGCSGSTSCSIKLFRYQILYAAMRAQIAGLIRPHRIYVLHYNNEAIPENITDTVFAFFFLFLLTFAVLACGLSLLGLDFVTSVSSAATAITNVGPGLGEIVGPAGNFSILPDAAKWLLAIGMLLGRLEIFTVLVLFTRSFWRA